jgi:DAK2 domain fusion protein YloV
VLETLDADGIRRWSAAAARTLEEHRPELDALNVFPVPDGDTGTNLAGTLRAGADAVAAGGGGTAAEALAELARAAVLQARGNSGVIVAQLLRGLAVAADGEPLFGAAQLRAGLGEGVREAYRAVAVPVEGTILTVARAAFDALPASGGSLAELLEAAVAGADTALAGTPAQLAELARAGVVDAGGRGLLLLLSELATVVTGRRPELSGVRAPAPGARAARESGSPAFAYEVQYLLDAPDPAVEQLRARLARLGDSVVLAGTGQGTWNVHVHVNDVGAAIEAGVAAGTTRRISVVRFDDQPSPGADVVPAGTAVVAVAPGEGMAHLFGTEGVLVVEPGPGAALVSPDAVVAAVRASGATQVVLLPNATAVASVAQLAADRVRDEGVRATVVPTRSPVQGLAAVAVHDPARRFDDDVVAMAEAAAATRFAEVTVAAEQSLTSVGICQAGDVLGLIDGEVVEIGHGVLSVGLALLDRLLGVGAELMTVLVGADAPAGTAELVERHVRERAPLTDIHLYPGGQPRYPLIIGVE